MSALVWNDSERVTDSIFASREAIKLGHLPKVAVEINRPKGAWGRFPYQHRTVAEWERR